MAAPERDVLLVGSIPLSDADEVFTTVSDRLGDSVHRIPDGETGPLRSLWIQAQRSVFVFNPRLQADPEPAISWAYGKDAPAPRARLRRGVSPDDVVFSDLYYADWAIESYGRFRRLKDRGAIAAETRFQVCLPTPLAPMAMVVPEDQPAIEPRYEAGMMNEIDKLSNAIQHDDLAIQWDVCIELNLWDGWRKSYISDDVSEVQAGITDRLVRIGEHVPSGVQLGYHLCYGDLGGRHFREPEDAGMMVDISKRLFARIRRPVAWLHMPVPVDRKDEAYFAPLKDLHLPSETRLYLGLVHEADGLKGAQERIEAAESAVADFGVATECGFGRRQPQAIPDLLTLHREICRLPLPS